MSKNIWSLNLNCQIRPSAWFWWASSVEVWKLSRLSLTFSNTINFATTLHAFTASTAFKLPSVQSGSFAPYVSSDFNLELLTSFRSDAITRWRLPTWYLSNDSKNAVPARVNPRLGYGNDVLCFLTDRNLFGRLVSRLVDAGWMICESDWNG